MELVGQFDSPFTRRVGITLEIYGLPFTHNTWSVFGNADDLVTVNPLIRVPALILDTGEALIETLSIIDYLDSQVSPERRLWPQTQPKRWQAQKIAAVASGVSDKAVVLFYELRLHDHPSTDYVARLSRQIVGALGWLDQACAARAGNWLVAERMTQADLAVACAVRHLAEAHPALFSAKRHPALAAHAERCEAMDVFQRISQEFVAPA
jgi:glutathione S-transferase